MHLFIVWTVGWLEGEGLSVLYAQLFQLNQRGCHGRAARLFTVKNILIDGVAFPLRQRLQIHRRSGFRVVPFLCLVPRLSV